MDRKTWIVVAGIGAVVIMLWLGFGRAKNRDPGNAGPTTGVGDATLGGTGSANDGRVSESPEVIDSAAKPGVAYSEENLSDAVTALLGLDGQDHNYNSLKRAISSLSNELSGDNVAALRDLLTWPNDRFPEGMRPIEINAVKNDVLDRLLRQQELPENIGLQLVEMASNPGNDPVWRDYCIQFMTPFYERASAGSVEQGVGSRGQGAELDFAAKDRIENKENSPVINGPVNHELDAVREAMVAALDERDGTIAGTSLIGLELLSRTHDEFDRDAIVGAAAEIAADESASPASRMTALRMSSVAGGDESTVESARSLAQTGETVLLRSAAIVTLGETGSKDDRELLESFAASDNRQISAAARMALEKMDARNL